MIQRFAGQKSKDRVAKKFKLFVVVEWREGTRAIV